MTNIKLIIVSTAAIVLSSCSPAHMQTAKTVAKTVNDAARIACEVAFGEEELPQGLTVKDVCDTHEDLQPFIDSILAAKAEAGVMHGMSPPPEPDEPEE